MCSNSELPWWTVAWVSIAVQRPHGPQGLLQVLPPSTQAQLPRSRPGDPASSAAQALCSLPHQQRSRTPAQCHRTPDVHGLAYANPCGGPSHDWAANIRSPIARLIELRLKWEKPKCRSLEKVANRGPCTSPMPPWAGSNDSCAFGPTTA